jgi:hypothetical protein
LLTIKSQASVGEKSEGKTPGWTLFAFSNPESLFFLFLSGEDSEN